MRKKFKARKKINLLKLFFCIFFVLLLFLLFKSFILTTKLASSNEEFLNKLLNDSNHYILYKNVNGNPIYSFVKLITKIDIKEPKSILEKSLKYKTNNMNISYTASDDVYSLNSDYIEDTNKDNNIENPIVYIYNTHQLEEYNKTNLEEYNIKPTIAPIKKNIKIKYTFLSILLASFSLCSSAILSSFLSILVNSFPFKT